ncbi:MAG: TrmO family methyltransferase domain-containing protein [Thermodesulforhabdaceae bacterium]
MDRNILKVKRIDMFDGTPILDIKPYVDYESRNSGENR